MQIESGHPAATEPVGASAGPANASSSGAGKPSFGQFLEDATAAPPTSPTAQQGADAGKMKLPGAGKALAAAVRPGSSTSKTAQHADVTAAAAAVAGLAPTNPLAHWAMGRAAADAATVPAVAADASSDAVGADAPAAGVASGT